MTFYKQYNCFKGFNYLKKFSNSLQHTIMIDKFTVFNCQKTEENKNNLHKYLTPMQKIEIQHEQAKVILGSAFTTLSTPNSENLKSKNLSTFSELPNRLA